MPRLLIALCCLVSLCLSGCSDSSSSSASSDPPSPSSSSPSPSPTEQPETPEAFVRRWVELANQLGRDGNPAPLLEASHRCDDCTSIATGVAEIYAGGGWIRGGDWRLVGAIELEDHGPRVTCNFRLAVEAGRYKASEDSPIQDTPGGTATIRATITKVGGAFKMNEFVRLAQ